MRSYGADRTPIHKAQSQLIARSAAACGPTVHNRPTPGAQARLRDTLVRAGAVGCVRLLILQGRCGQSAAPGLVAEAPHPVRVGFGQADQAVAWIVLGV